MRRVVASLWQMDVQGEYVKGEDADGKLPGRLGEMSLARQVLTLAIWPLAEQILSFFVGMTDILIAGRMAVGEVRVAVLDAMGLGGYVV